MIFNFLDIRLWVGIGMFFIFLKSEKGNEIMKNVIFKISWKLLECHTLINEFYKKTLRPKFHELTDNYFRKSIIIVKNGEEILSFKNYMEASNLLNNEEINYDFILQTKFNKTDSKKNYTTITDKLVNYDNDNIEVSDIGFIIFQLSFKTDNGVEKYEINMKEPKNYLVKDNVLKSNFFKYYMKKTYQIDLADDFNIFYMTNDMNQSNLTNPFFIKFNDVGLTSFPIKKEIMDEKEVRKQEEKDYKTNLISNIINQEKLKEHIE